MSASFTPEYQNIDKKLAVGYKEVYYDIMSIAYDKSKLFFGKIETLVKASKINKSATFPRISSDGKFMIKPIDFKV